jgi:hypothetical protein
MKLCKVLLVILIEPMVALGQGVTFDLHEYKPLEGLKADVVAGQLQVNWRGDGNQQLRAVFGVKDRQPLVRELAVRRGAAAWSVLARNLTPEFDVVSGRRRISEQQLAPLRELGCAITPELVEKEKWNAFGDAPLDIPGTSGTNRTSSRKIRL